jgi:UDP-N-acetylmuramyl pentapeptide phosphotransferase/UDP-N-acetylglucosamine-1-phosphate transferase
MRSNSLCPITEFMYGLGSPPLTSAPSMMDCRSLQLFWMRDVNYFAALVAFVVTAVLIGLLLPIASKIGMLDLPEGRKDHDVPTPVVGGFAMLVGCGLVLLMMPRQAQALWAFLAASTMIVAIGMYDDRHDLHWFWRLGVHALAALLMVYWGGVQVQQVGPLLGVQSTGLGVLSVPFTVFATVGLINAMNMIDGSDGLAGSLGLAALVMLGTAAIYAGNVLLADRVLVVAGAVAGFLFWNLRFPWRRRARTFMGDAGRDHIHHLMSDAGFAPMRIVVVLTAFSLLCGLAAALLLRLHISQPLLLVAYLLLCLGWYLLTRRRERAIAFFRRMRGGGPLPVEERASL